MQIQEQRSSVTGCHAVAESDLQNASMEIEWFQSRVVKAYFERGVHLRPSTPFEWMGQENQDVDRPLRMRLPKPKPIPYGLSKRER